MPFLQRLKTILQSNSFYVVLIIFMSIFVFITTIIFKYDIKYDNPKYLEGIVTEITFKDDKINFILKTPELVKCTYYLKDNEEIANFLGKKILVTGSVNNTYSNRIPNTFNYQTYLYNKRIYLTYEVTDFKIIHDENIFYQIKNQIINRINSYDTKTKTYLNLFLLGDKNYLDTETYNNYLDNGIWYLFAVSGMHVSLFILVLNNLCKRVKFKRVIISLILLYFIFLTNFTASIIRAVIFYILESLNDYFKINLSRTKVLFLTASLMLLYNPFFVYNVGFLYSFIVTLGIILRSPKITGNYCLKILKISLVAFLVSLPITINVNYEINFLSIFLSIIYVPLVSLVIFPLSILTFIFKLFSPLLVLLLSLLEKSNTFFASFNLNLIVPKMPFLLIIIYYILLHLAEKKEQKRYFFLLCLLCLLNYNLPKLDRNFYVYYLDVGQGDASVIISPYQKEVIMIDTGGSVYSSYHVSDNIIIFFHSLGIKNIDYLIITHGDYDHAGETLNLLSKFSISKVIFNNDSFNTLEKNIKADLDKKKIPYYLKVTALNLDKYNLSFLNYKNYDNENDNSNVIYTKLDNYNFLFMGDASVKVEEDLLKKYDLKTIDVLKVGHHGSKTSSSKSFISSINPHYAIISVGKNNRYGHPHAEVLENLKNSIIYRTDEMGTIRFKIQNKKMHIKKYS